MVSADALTALRSVAFNLLALAWTLILIILYLPLLLCPRWMMQKAVRFWVKSVLVLLSVCCGLSHHVRGRENLPTGPALIAAKHQSAWDTIIFHLLLADPVFVIKKELLDLPVFGWYLRRAGNIAIDRSAGFRALRTMLPAAEQRLREGAHVVVFPEGTRVAPGHREPYHVGIGGLYERMGVPVVPVALNSGLFWGRNSFFKRPGVITLELLPTIPAGLSRTTFLKTLETDIEGATDRLVAEAQGQPAAISGTLGRTAENG